MATIKLYADKINQMQGLIKETKQTVTDYRSELLTLKTKMLTINKSVCDLEDIMGSIQASSQTQEEKITSLDTFHKEVEAFIAEVVRIDSDAADIIRQRKGAFYAQYRYLKPEYEKEWLEKVKDWFVSAGEWCREQWKLTAKTRYGHMQEVVTIYVTMRVLAAEAEQRTKKIVLSKQLKEFAEQLRTNSDRIYMTPEQIKMYKQLKETGWFDWESKEGSSEEISIPPELKKYYDNAKYLISKINEVNPDNTFDYDLDNFKKIYENNVEIYNKISEETGVPPELIAAFHYRESGCNFNTYLHNGQELGTPTTIVPKDRIFNDFAMAAVDALENKQKSSGINLTLDSNIITMMTFAEIYNGTGYTDYRDMASPYVYSGTNVYEKGKYTSDKKFNAEVKDKQPGVYMLVMSILEE